MPYIFVNTPTKMTDDQKTALKSHLGKNISLIEGKKEDRLMIQIADNCDMYFGGLKKPEIAFVEVRLFRQAPFEEKQLFIESVFQGLKNVLSIDNSDAFISITEHLEWGSGGTLRK